MYGSRLPAIRVSLEGLKHRRRHLRVELEVDYPAGVLFAGPLGEMYVHHEAVTIPVRLQRVGEITGRPRIMVTYQVCTDQACLAPETRAAPIQIEAR